MVVLSVGGGRRKKEEGGGRSGYNTKDKNPTRPGGEKRIAGKGEA